MNNSARLGTSSTVQEKRQVIYASLMRYAPETVPLRERALDRMVLTALMGSSEADPLRVGKIQANLVLGPKAPPIRGEVIEESLRRLTQAGVIVN